MRWRQVAILGVGLMGGSLGLSLKKRGLAGRVVGYARRPEAREACLLSGAVDEMVADPARAVDGADLVVLCVPVGSMAAIMEACCPVLKAGAVVTDVGSVKASVVEALTAMVAQACGVFVGSHPMAGSEETGVEAAREDLYEDAVCVVTPVEDTPTDALERVTAFWTELGGVVLALDPARHDELVSRSSHLPHMVAAAVARWVLDPEHGDQQRVLCATGFRDATRIAGGSATMWCEIAMQNRDFLVRDLKAIERGLAGLRSALESGDAAAVLKFLAEAKERREAPPLAG